jgi:hypothetical protein
MKSTPQSGISPTEYPTTPLLLEKTIKKHNILIGDDPVQQRFAEQFLTKYHHSNVVCQVLEVCNDDHLLGKEEPLLYRVNRSSQLDNLSPHVRSRTGLWSLDLIESGSAGANAIVRFAATLAKIPRPSREVIAYVAKEITNNLNDIPAAIWYSLWLILGPVVEKRRWPRPWDNYLTWLPRGEDPGYRLNSLYWELVQYVFATDNDEKGFRKTGHTFRPREFKHLTSLTLPKARVFLTLEILSAWREHRTDPYVCALRVSRAWGKIAQ